MWFVLPLTLLLGWTVRQVVVANAVVMVVDPVAGMSGDLVVGIAVFAEAPPGACKNRVSHFCVPLLMM